MSSRTFWRVLAALLLALPASAELNERQLKSLDGITRDRFSARWADLDTNQLTALHRRADAYLAQLRDRHLVGGLVASIRYADTNRAPVVRYEGLEDSAAWTGLALATHAYRYAVTRDSRSLADIRALLSGIELLLNANDRSGYLPRFAGRADDAAYAKFYATYGGADAARPGLGKLAFAGSGTNSGLVWLGGPSRDQYAALNLGFVTVWQLVRNDAKIRERVAAAATLLLDRLQTDGWRLDDGQGQVTFITPALGTALLRTGATVRPDRFTKPYEQRARGFLELPAPGVVRYGDSRPGLFSALNLLALSRLETNQSRRLHYQDQLTQLWRGSSPQLNPLLAACYLGGFDRTPGDATALATLHGVLSQFPDPPRWSAARDHSAAPAIPVLTLGGARWAQFAQPLDRRPVAPFQWTQSAYLLAGGEDAPVAHPGVDFLLAFWMGRDASVIPGEDAVPSASALSPAARRAARTNAPGGRTNLPAATIRPSRPRP